MSRFYPHGCSALVIWQPGDVRVLAQHFRANKEVQNPGIKPRAAWPQGSKVWAVRLCVDTMRSMSGKLDPYTPPAGSGKGPAEMHTPVPAVRGGNTKAQAPRG